MDSVYKEIGELGYEQFKYIAILSLLRANTALHLFNYIFVSQNDQFGIGKEWDLVQDRSWLIPMTFALLEIGGFFGPLVSRFGDVLGRKSVICVNVLMQIVTHQIGGFTDR